MKDEKLWEFVRYIVASGATDKKTHALLELQDILKKSGAQKSQIDYIDFVIKNLPEVTEFSGRAALSQKDLEIIQKRGEERRRREEEARNQRRC